MRGLSLRLAHGAHREAVSREHFRRDEAPMLTLGGFERKCRELLLIRRQLRQRVTRAALLETSGPLQVVQLAKDIHARGFTQRDRTGARRIVNCIRNPGARRLDVLECDQAFNSRALLVRQLIGQSEFEMDCN